MWKKATKIILYSFIIIGILSTIILSLTTGLSTYIIGISFNTILQLPEIETFTLFTAIISASIILLLGISITFMGATSIGLMLEIAEDIAQIKENTNHIFPNQPQQPIEKIDINKYIYPYQ